MYWSLTKARKISLSIFLVTVFFLGACSKEKDNIILPEPPVDTTSPVNGYKSYLALGDSYTIGASVPIEDRFPVQATAALMAAGVRMYPAEIKAASGWTTFDLANSIAGNPPSKNTYDLVTLLIGVNNQYQGRSQAEYRTEFTQLLNKAINYAGGKKYRVFVLSIPDYSVTPFAAHSDTVRISDEIDAFNTINREISLQAGVGYIDITPISREGRTFADLQAADGLHPSGKQYSRWVALLAPLMKASL